MKKYILIITMFITTISFTSFASYSISEYGDVFFEKNADELWPTASIAKVMNVLVALDEVDKNNISLDDEITFDRETIDIKGSHIEVSLNKKYTLRSLLEAELVYSANNAAYAVAKYVGKGSIDNFVELMNKKARKMGIKNTVFYTPAGLPTSITKMPLDVSNAKDLYQIAKYALNDKRILEWSSKKSIEVDGNKYISRNKNLGFYGNIGLKTGFHSISKFNMLAINNINGTNIINITLGDDSANIRFIEQNNLAKNVSEQFKTIYKKDEFYSKIEVLNSKEKEIEAIFGKDFVFYTTNFSIEEKIEKLEGTVNVGDKIGEVIISKNRKIIDTIPIIAKTKTTKLSLIERIKVIILNILKKVF